jgi:hypothetical protein
MIRLHRFPRFLMMVCTTIALAGCKPSPEAPRDVPQQTGDSAMNLTIHSPAFDNNTVIPQRFTGDGADVSPELHWDGVPEEARELALIMDDPDAPTPEPWVHWVIYRLPGNLTALPEGIPRQPIVDALGGAMQGVNTWQSDNVGYRGPAPPPGHGVHHYHFKLYALKGEIEHAKPGARKGTLLMAMQGLVLAQAELVGLYKR